MKILDKDYSTVSSMKAGTILFFILVPKGLEKYLTHN